MRFGEIIETTLYHTNGRVKADGNSVDGLPDGPWYFYREDGSLDSEKSGVYENGIKIR